MEIIVSYKTYKCDNGQTAPNTFTEIAEKLNMTQDTKIYTFVSETALINGFELYSSLLHCPQNKFTDLVLKEFFGYFKNPKALLQSTSNLINSRQAKHLDSVNLDHLYQFGQAIHTNLGLNLAYIIPRILEKENRNIFAKNQYPFMKTLHPLHYGLCHVNRHFGSS